ncbi:hypothetical protein [Streptomyces sp. B6B3]|uniref:hypothetical protein n=1 Tax=Streptomyces sp. B6B3 TaxID=3153570 RepID=UPI00325E1964
MRDESDPATVAGRELGKGGTSQADEAWERLRREADDLPTGQPPVAEVMREGRRLRRRRHLAVTTACVVAVSLPLTVADFSDLLPDGGAQGSVNMEAGGDTADDGPHMVEPLERIDIGHGLPWSLALRSADPPLSGDEGYLLCRTEDFDEAVQLWADEGADSGTVGTVAGPGLRGFLTVTSNATIISGTWVTESGLPPRQVLVTWDDDVTEATLLTTPASAGWGVYYVVLDRLPTLAEEVEDGEGFVLTGRPEDLRVELVPATPEDSLAPITAEDMETDPQIDGSHRFLGTLSPPE